MVRRAREKGISWGIRWEEPVLFKIYNNNQKSYWVENHIFNSTEKEDGLMQIEYMP